MMVPVLHQGVGQVHAVVPMRKGHTRQIRTIQKSADLLPSFYMPCGQRSVGYGINTVVPDAQ